MSKLKIYGLDELVDSNGAVKVAEITSVIKVVQQEFVRRQEDEMNIQEQASADPFLEQMLENERLKEEELKTFYKLKNILDDLDPDKEPSIKVKSFIARNIGNIYKYGTTEYKQKSAKVTSTGLSPELDEILDFAANFKYGEVVNLHKQNVSSKKIHILQKMGYVDKDGNITEYNIDRACADRDIENQIISDYTMSFRELLSKGVTPEEICAKFEKKELPKEQKAFLKKNDKTLINVLSCVIKLELKREDNPERRGKLGVFLNKFESIYEVDKDSNEVSGTEERLIQTQASDLAIDVDSYFDVVFEDPSIEFFEENSARIEEIDIKNEEQENIEEPVQEVNEDQTQHLENTEKVLEDDYNSYTIPQIETKKSLLERMQESKNPFARAISNGLMAMTGRNKKALPEASTKPRSFDSNATGFDITDSDLFPTKGMAFKKTIQKLFNKKKAAEPERIPIQTIKPLNANDFNSRISVSEEQLKGNSEIKIPTSININKKTINAEQKAQKDHDDELTF